MVKKIYFAWDGNQLLSDNSNEKGFGEFIYRPDTFVPFAIIKKDIGYYETDSIGLPHEIINIKGELLWSVIMKPSGKRIENDNILENNIHLQGQYYDNELELSYNRYRYFCLETGRFISQDPLGLNAGLDLYLYAPNIWSWIDPLGLSCGNASSSLPSLKGKSETQIRKTLSDNGFTQTRVSNSPARNETWRHMDGSEVRIHPYGNQKTSNSFRSANNAHVHKQDPLGNQLTDRGIVSSDASQTHIGIRNPQNLPTIRQRPHGHPYGPLLQ